MNYNQDNITKAWFFASKAHKEQKYPKEQLPYLNHLGSANETMAKRLNKKIELYSSFISNV
ncbi:MAG: hypothetical protein KU29_10315 [Sulfurovum sp. FS06-10]|jgi:(p)ppGpp synthase/HD superfamily hydrolase|nr:MAG: hypothetical protein KU29_10315 [Sulfurovum sp. FS06-10]